MPTWNALACTRLHDMQFESDDVISRSDLELWFSNEKDVSSVSSDADSFSALWQHGLKVCQFKDEGLSAGHSKDAVVVGLEFAGFFGTPHERADSLDAIEAR